MMRRGIGLLLAVVLALGVLAPVHAQETTKVRVGYLHTVAVDSIMWVGIAEGIFAKHGIEIEPVQFNSGVPLMQALSGGSVDVAIMGAVISNFPSRGVGKIFLLNNVEYNTAMIMVQGDSGIERVTDLMGKQVATTRGTTAHVMLFNALKSAAMDQDAVELINMDMAAAVSAFIARAVPAVALWLPFDAQVREQNPTARVLTTAADYFPEAAIMGGWVASNSFYARNRDALKRIAQAWLEVNHMLLTDTDRALRVLHETAYSNLPYEDIDYAFNAQLNFTNDEWAEQYRSGQAAEWIGQVEQVFLEIGAFDTFVEPEEFFDTSIFLEAYDEWKQGQ